MENFKLRNLNLDNGQQMEVEGSPRKPKILIVEDNPGIDEFLHDALASHADAEEGSYRSAEEAIRMLEGRKSSDPEIDLLLTDLGLGDDKTAGTRVVEVFKKKFPKACVVFLTGSPEKIDKLYTSDRIKALNIIDVLGKPVSLGKLIGTVSKAKDSINKLFKV